jgi:methyl-accepting chemotaxis protein
MRIVTKFNLVLFGVSAVAMGCTGYMSYTILQENAKREVIQHAGMLLETALAIRGYTSSEIDPLLVDQMKTHFLPQSVPAYAATQSFEKVRQDHPDYSYKEATLNPINLRNRAVDWENDIIRAFRDNAAREQIIGVRTTPTGPSLYLARPIQVKSESCLSCHGKASEAPQTMLALYGSNNGFGWKMNEIIGAQIVSVPMSLPQHSAQLAFIKFMGMLAAIFLTMIILLNVMLRRIILKPVIQIAAQANDISMGNMQATEFNESGKDELSTLAVSFNRMRRSLQKAMRMLEDKNQKLN